MKKHITESAMLKDVLKTYNITMKDFKKLVAFLKKHPTALTG